MELTIDDVQNAKFKEEVAFRMVMIENNMDDPVIEVVMIEKLIASYKSRNKQIPSNVKVFVQREIARLSKFVPQRIEWLKKHGDEVPEKKE
ncbi:hypothetical protein ACFL0W_06105 [Nanoarchaeota archaeon]